jgi:hypothetical protein
MRSLIATATAAQSPVTHSSALRLATETSAKEFRRAALPSELTPLMLAWDEIIPNNSQNSTALHQKADNRHKKTTPKRRTVIQHIIEAATCPRHPERGNHHRAHSPNQTIRSPDEDRRSTL